MMAPWLPLFIAGLSGCTALAVYRSEELTFEAGSAFVVALIWFAIAAGLGSPL